MNVKISLIIASFYLIAILSSCQNVQSNNNLIDTKIEYTINVNKNDLVLTSKKNLSDLIKDYKLIKLETNNNCLIGSVSKIQVSNNNIYISDNKITQSLYVFDLKGKYLFKINNIGRGPLENLYLADFVVNEFTDEIVILDSETKKIVFYDNNGKPLREQILPFFADYFEILDKDHYCFLGSALEDRVILWDALAQKVYKKFIPYNLKQSTKVLKPLDNFNNSILYTRELNDTILKISKDNLSESRVIDFKEFKIKNDSQLQKGFMGTMTPVGECMTGIRLYSESDDFIYFVFDYQKSNSIEHYYSLYSKKSKKTLFYSNTSLIDDIVFYPYAPQIETVTKNGEFIFPIPAVEIIKSFKVIKKTKDKFKEGRVNNFIDFAKDINETDNPIIAFYKFKND